MSEGVVMEHQLYTFFESIMCAYFPTPGRSVDNLGTSSGAWVEVFRPRSTGMSDTS